MLIVGGSNITHLILIRLQELWRIMRCVIPESRATQSCILEIKVLVYFSASEMSLVFIKICIEYYGLEINSCEGIRQ